MVSERPSVCPSDGGPKKKRAKLKKQKSCSVENLRGGGLKKTGGSLKVRVNGKSTLNNIKTRRHTEA